MIRQEKLDLSTLEGQTFVIGREGHIYLHDETVSRKHASIRVSGGRIYLADLGSRNGTYLVKKDQLSIVDGGPVSPLQQVLIGDHRYRVTDLLSIASKFYGTSAQATLVHPVRTDLAV